MADENTSLTSFAYPVSDIDQCVGHIHVFRLQLRRAAQTVRRMRQDVCGAHAAPPSEQPVQRDGRRRRQRPVAASRVLSRLLQPQGLRQGVRGVQQRGLPAAEVRGKGKGEGGGREGGGGRGVPRCAMCTAMRPASD